LKRFHIHLNYHQSVGGCNTIPRVARVPILINAAIIGGYSIDPDTAEWLAEESGSFAL
jgi:hypothetical protein